MTDEERTVIACVPAMGDEYVATGSVVTRCADCDRPIWLSPTGMDVVRDKGAETICIPCIQVIMKDDPDPQIQPINEDQRREILREIGRLRRRPPV